MGIDLVFASPELVILTVYVWESKTPIPTESLNADTSDASLWA